jgi:hypothetical protein
VFIISPESTSTIYSSSSTFISTATTSKISLNKDELKYLKQTRDTLLPKLMSGQLRVDEFKENAV